MWFLGLGDCNCVFWAGDVSDVSVDKVVAQRSMAQRGVAIIQDVRFPYVPYMCVCAYIYICILKCSQVGPSPLRFSGYWGSGLPLRPQTP